MRASVKIVGSVLGAVLATSALACSSGATSSSEGAPEQTTSAWTCAHEEVPMGTAVSCVGPSNTAAPTECATDDPNCPSNIDLQGCDDGSGMPGTDAGSNDGGDSCSGECCSVPDLTYCGGDDDGGASTDDGGTLFDAGKSHGNGNGNGGNPHTQPDAGSGDCTCGNDDGGAAPSPTPPPPPSGGWHCDDDGQKRTCHTTPTCAPGTHLAPCGACVPDGSNDDCTPPDEGGCWITGGGFILDADGKDTFGGNGKPMRDGTVQGEWEHVDHGTGHKAHTKITYLYCRHVDEPGPGNPGGKNKGFDINQVYYGGPARWFGDAGWEDGYWVDLFAEDHGEPGNLDALSSGKQGKGSGMPDHYHFTIRKEADPSTNQSGTVVYETANDLQGGNIQIHPANNGHPYTPMQPPSWVSMEP